MLNTFQLRTFLAVVETGSYTAAAELLHMSQPAVSQHIRALEEQLGTVRLFRRVGQRMRPTHAGEVLLDMARELVDLAERAEQRILALKGEIAGRVVIGCTPSSGERLLAPLLAVFHSQYRAVALETRIASYDLLLSTIESQHVDLVLLEEQHRRKGWETQTLGQEQLDLVVPLNHPLLKIEQVPPGMLGEVNMLLPRPGSPMRRTIDEWLRKQGLVVERLQVALESDSVSLLIQGVRDGLGLAFVPFSRRPRGDDLGLVTLPGAPLQQDWFLLRNRERSESHASQELFNFLTGEQAQALLNGMGVRA